VKGFLRRQGSLDFEAELRAHRSEPRPEFVSTLARKVQGERERKRLRTLRIAFAAGLSTATLAAFAAFGGVAYTAGAVQSASNANQTSSASQYKFTLCHRLPGENAQTITVGSPEAVNAHFSNHPGDTPGACP
jgi:hypothetical protein